MAEKLPRGLHYCASCGAVRGSMTIRENGEVVEMKSTCFCEGLVCTKCGCRRRRRPISDYFDPEDGQWWHVPYFMGMVRTCRECRN